MQWLRVKSLDQRLDIHLNGAAFGYRFNIVV
jgi:hypothetical protein